jgi:hypothetical protein
VCGGYIWEMGEDAVTWWLEEKGGDAAFRGRFNAERAVIEGEWRLRGGGYQLTMTKRA